MNQLREQATKVTQALQQQGFKAYFVGGCVRDQLLDPNAEPHDFDVATNAPVEAVEATFPKTIPVGRQFGIVVVVDEAGNQCQVARFRTDGKYTDNRRPDNVTFGTLEEDVWRRDFTINALAFDPCTQTIYDHTGGQEDLKARQIRTCGKAQDRFTEDPLRLLRAVRFAAKLDFAIESTTWEAIRNNADLIKKVSAERVRDELTRIWTQPNAHHGLQLLQDSTLLKHVLPEIAVLQHCDQSLPHHPEGNVFNHVKLMLKALPNNPSPTLAWATVLHDVAKPRTAAWNADKKRWTFYDHDKQGAEMAETILRRLKSETDLITNVKVLITHHMVLKNAAEWNKSTLRQHLLRPQFAEEIQLQRLDALGSDGNLATVELLTKAVDQMAFDKPAIKPLLDGNTLILHGIHAGPEIGKIHRALIEAQLEGHITTQEQALKWLEKQQQTEQNQLRYLLSRDSKENYRYHHIIQSGTKTEAITAIQLLAKHQPDYLGYCNNEGQTPAHLAILREDLDILQAIVTGNPVATYLSIAIDEKKLDLLGPLLAIGRKAKSPANKTQQLNHENEALKTAIRNNNIAAITLLHEHSVDIHFSPTVRHPVNLAVVTNHPAALQELLRLGASPNINPHHALFTANSAPLHEATRLGHTKMISMLAQANANMDYRDHNDMTALDVAITTGSTATVIALLEGHANPNLPNKSGTLPLTTAIHRSHTAIIEALIAATQMDQKTSNEFLATVVQRSRHTLIAPLIAKGADPNHTPPPRNSQDPPIPLLGIAIENNDSITLKTLLEQGANPNRWWMDKDQITCIAGAYATTLQNRLSNHTEAKQILATMLAATQAPNHDAAIQTANDVAQIDSKKAVIWLAQQLTPTTAKPPSRTP